MPRATAAPDPSRQLMIKTKACQRLQKEVAHYRQEVAQNEAEWKRVESDPTKDEYDAKRFRDIWEESVRMVPDAERRYERALEDLFAHIQQHFPEDASSDTEDRNEWLSGARDILSSSGWFKNSSKKESTEGEGICGETTNIDDLAQGEAF